MEDMFDRVFCEIRKNTWAIVLVAVIISFIFPIIGWYLQPYLSYLLMALMFLSCLDLKTNEIINSCKDYKKGLLILAIIHLLSPFIIFLLRGFLREEIFLGLIIVSVAPAARSTVFLSNIYGGQPIKALVISTISNALSPIVVPLLVLFFARTSIKIETDDMISTLVKLVIIPLILAIFIGKLKFGKQLNKYSPSISVIVLFLIIIGIIAPVRNVILENINQSIFLAILVVALNLLTFALGYSIGSTKAEKITYGIVSSYKNYTLATLLALTLFNPIVALPTVIYTVIGNILIVPLQFLKAINCLEE